MTCRKNWKNPTCFPDMSIESTYCRNMSEKMKNSDKCEKKTYFFIEIESLAQLYVNVQFRYTATKFCQKIGGRLRLWMLFF